MTSKAVSALSEAGSPGITTSFQSQLGHLFLSSASSWEGMHFLLWLSLKGLRALAVMEMLPFLYLFLLLLCSQHSRKLAILWILSPRGTWHLRAICAGSLWAYRKYLFLFEGSLSVDIHLPSKDAYYEASYQPRPLSKALIQFPFLCCTDWGDYL